MLKKRILALIPFSILAGIALYTMGEFTFSDFSATVQHRIAFGLVAVNACLYFARFRPAILVTGIILLAATCNFITFFVETTVWSIGIGGLHTPSVQVSMLGLFIIWGVLEFDLLTNWYLDYKESKQR
jgi:hypothetical protein